jgi:site-specific DNA recombinase
LSGLPHEPYIPSRCFLCPRLGEEHCRRKDWSLVETFVEPGLSATDDNRPELLRMVEAATSPARPFDVVLVHSMSRLFRDQFLSEVYIRKLRKAGVEVQSITQELTDNPTGNMIRQVLGAFDQYQSAETAKHTLRAMQENARQGFWNGSAAPYGYTVVESERRGAKIKKVLAIQEQEAAIVTDIYDWALGRSGMPLGVKAIVNRLNASGHTHRGKPFHISSVYRILTSTTYAGTHVFNRLNASTRQPKPHQEWIGVAVPAIVSPEDHERVRSSLSARSPKRVAPRIVGNPTLLTGLARCGICGSGMTLRTGKSGRYRYYVCAGRAQKGATLCRGRSISMPMLDGLVTDHLADRLFTPARLRVILEAYINKSADGEMERLGQLARARKALTEAEGKITRLLELVEHGALAVNDPAMRERLDLAKEARRAATEQVKWIEARNPTGMPTITPEKIDRFAAALRIVMTSDDPSFRKAYLRLFVDDVIVNESEIILRGPKQSLAKGAGSGGLPPAAAVVPSFVREWRPVRDSNSCYRRERAVS